MPFTGPREDKEAIRELYASYSDAGACQASDDFVACFAEDGQWNTHVFERQGKAELLEQWDQLWLAFEKVGFLTEIGSIEIDGDRAACRCVAHEIIHLKAGGLYKLTGKYRDALVKQNGRWVFARRDYELIGEEVSA